MKYLKELNKKQAKAIIKEFKKVHTEYSMNNYGHFKKNWKAVMKFADLKDGHWFWKGYDINLLHRKYEKWTKLENDK